MFPFEVRFTPNMEVWGVRRVEWCLWSPLFHPSALASELVASYMNYILFMMINMH